jgi:hypothetical protein
MPVVVGVPHALAEPLCLEQWLTMRVGTGWDQYFLWRAYQSLCGGPVRFHSITLNTGSSEVFPTL